ncbi:MAG: hypothetical protein O2876_05935 [Proteobacteria bacterium]|nr:hypothetical protein [Pseudomonadota bacterium]
MATSGSGIGQFSGHELMVRGRKQETGVALAIVLWLVAALSMMAAGLASLSRDEVSSAATNSLLAKSFYLGKGVARVVMLDRRLAAKSNSGSQSNSGSSNTSGLFSARYAIDGVAISATVFPANGFLSVSGAEVGVWAEYLLGVGGLDATAASQLLENMAVTPVAGGRDDGSVITVDTSTFGGLSRAYGSRGTGGTFYVETLLGAEGMTRDLYDSIKRNIAPFRHTGTFNPALAPADIQAALSLTEAPLENQAEAAGGNYFCVEVIMEFGGNEAFAQRIWVDTAGGTEGALRFVRVERPVAVSALG